MIGAGVEQSSWTWLLDGMGQQLFRPPSVAGWDWGQAIAELSIPAIKTGRVGQLAIGIGLHSRIHRNRTKMKMMFDLGLIHIMVIPVPFKFLSA